MVIKIFKIGVGNIVQLLRIFFGFLEDFSLVVRICVEYVEYFIVIFKFSFRVLVFLFDFCRYLCDIYIIYGGYICVYI